MTTKDTAERIMDAALQLVSEKGYKATTTKAIAQIAEVNEVTIFRHFGNKRGILKAIVDKFSYNPILQHTLKELATWDLETDLLNFSIKYFDYMMSIKDFVMISFKESIHFPEIDEEIAKVPLFIKNELMHYFEEMYRKGKIRAVDFEATALSLIAINFGLFISRARMGTNVTEIPPKDLIQNSIAIFSRGLAS